MKQKRFSDEQIIGILKEDDAGAVVRARASDVDVSSSVTCSSAWELLAQKMTRGSEVLYFGGK